MSFTLLWPQVGALQGAGGPAWTAKVLFAGRRQPLLVPADNPPQARAALAVFVANPLWRWLGRAHLRCDRWLPARWRLPTIRWENFPARKLFGAAAQQQSGHAVLCGSPGPLQKIAVLHMAGDRQRWQLAKIAVRPSADTAVGLEAAWLDRLGAAAGLAGFVPRLTATGTLACGRRFVAMSAIPDGGTATRFGGAHRSFLAALGALGPTFLPWSDTEAFTRLQSRARAVTPLLGSRHSSLVWSALEEIEREIGARSLPACYAHGDFAPWNVRDDTGSLFVFDWEYAESNGNPLQDYLHFHLMSRLARHRPVGPRFMRPLVLRAARHAETVFGANSGVAEAAGALASHYLLDVVTFYVDASRQLDPRHPVLRAYLRLLEQRARWLPAGTTGGVQA